MPTYRTFFNLMCGHSLGNDSITDVGFWSGAQLDGYVVGHSDSDHTSSSQSPSDLLSEFLNIPVLLILKGPKRRPIETTPIFPSLSGRAQFQDGFPLFLTSMESLRDLTGYVGVAASGKDQKWRVGKLDAERWKDGGKLEMERFVPFVPPLSLFLPDFSRFFCNILPLPLLWVPVCCSFCESPRTNNLLLLSSPPMLTLSHHLISYTTRHDYTFMIAAHPCVRASIGTHK